MTKLSKAQKWLLFYCYLGFFALVVVSDSVSYLLGKNGVVSDSMVASLQKGSGTLLFVCFMAMMLKIYRNAEKRS